MRARRYPSPFQRAGHQSQARRGRDGQRSRRVDARAIAVAANVIEGLKPPKILPGRLRVREAHQNAGIAGIRVHDRHLREECRIVPEQIGEVCGESRRRRIGNPRERLAMRRVREVCSESITAFQFFL